MKKTYLQPEIEFIDMMSESEMIMASGESTIITEEDGTITGVGFKDEDFEGGAFLSRVLFGQ